MKNKLFLAILGLFSILILSSSASAQVLDIDTMQSPIFTPTFPDTGDDVNVLCGYTNGLESIDNLTISLYAHDHVVRETTILDAKSDIYYALNNSYIALQDEEMSATCYYQDGVKETSITKNITAGLQIDDKRWYFANVDTPFPALSYYANKYIDTIYSSMFDTDQDGFPDVDNYDLTQEDIIGAKIQYDVPKSKLPYNLYLVVMPRGTKEQRPEGIDLARDDTRWQCPNDRGYFKTKSECTRIYNFTNSFDYYRIKTESKDILEGIPLNKTKEYDIYIFSNAYVKNDNQTIYVQPGGSKDFIGTFQPNNDHLIIPVEASDYVIKDPWFGLVFLGFLLGLGILLLSANFKLGIIFEFITLIILIIRIFLL